MSAMDTSVFWVEYVLRHKGAQHMRYSALDLNIVQRNSLDVVAFILLVLYAGLKVAAYVTKRGFCWIWSKFGFYSKKTNKKVKKN
jgi:glucuronosyltransferase